MMHELAAPLLPDHLEGRLSGRLREDMEGHADACSQCQALTESYKVLAWGFRTEAAAGAAHEASDAPSRITPRVTSGMSGPEWASEAVAHPPVDDLVELALAESAPGASRPLELAAHLEACASCAREFEAVRISGDEVERASRRRGSIPRPLRGLLPRRWTPTAVLQSPLAAPLAAGIVVAVLAYPAFLGLSRLPRAERGLEALRAAQAENEGRAAALTRSIEDREDRLRRLASWTGSIAVPLLAAAARVGTPQETTIPVTRDQPFVCLAVDPGLPEADDAARSYRAEILGSGGRSAWSFEMKAADVRSQMALAGSVAFLVPAAELPPGSYRFRMTRRTTASDKLVLDAPLSIVLSAGAPSASGNPGSE